MYERFKKNKNGKRISFLLILIVFSLPNFVTAQHQDIGEKPDLWRGERKPAKDSTSLLSAFKKGVFKGNIRSYHSVTQNEGELTNYFANAVGGGVRYQTGQFYGFDAALSGFFVFNLGSSDFTKTDPLTGASNRYEIQLFNLEEPENSNPIERIEELFIRYNFKKGFISWGRQLVNTPFINLQDGRMRPTGVEGVIAEYQLDKIFRIESAWINAVSPRGTAEWFSVEESIGITSMGLNPTDGSRGNYRGNVQSEGIGYLAILAKKDGHTFQFWNNYVENIVYSGLLQWDYTHVVSKEKKLSVGLQVIRQVGLGNGGNDDPTKTYAPKAHRALTFGLTSGYSIHNWRFDVNVNRITGEGRFLNPREWGRDPFYTFMPRERNEGLGDVWAFMGKVSWKKPKNPLKAALLMGYYNLPDVKQVALNKYALPGYAQANLDIRCTFSGKLESLELQWLSVYKIAAEDTYGNLRIGMNKVNMFHSNLILNFYF